MANIPVDEAPNLNLDMENFTDKTPVHFDEMNSRHKQHLNNEKALLYPTFDDSGTASGILSFTDFLATVKNRMRLFDFFKNFKTGMQFVMHLGKAANNCTTTATGLYLDARQGKVLMDLYTKLNSDLNNKVDINVSNTHHQQLRFDRIVGINKDSYRNAPIVVRAATIDQQASRAQIGFENGGINAGVLWLDINGSLKFTDQNGDTFLISMSLLK